MWIQPLLAEPRREEPVEVPVPGTPVLRPYRVRPDIDELAAMTARDNTAALMGDPRRAFGARKEEIMTQVDEIPQGYWQDAKGALIPLSAVKPEHQEEDECWCASWWRRRRSCTGVSPHSRPAPWATCRRSAIWWPRNTVPSAAGGRAT
ncbi:hypothetical protein V6L77_00800 [Pannonibacter sp. Pt2-lr]